MAGKVVTLVKEKIVPIIENLGYEVVDVEYKSQPDKNMHLVFYIYNEAGISLDDCEKVHYAIDPALDELNPTDDAPYCLDVSSPGLDRPFKTERDYARNMGKEIEIKLYAHTKLEPENPKCRAEKYYEGVLTGFDGKTVRFTVEGKEYSLETEKIASVRQLIKF